MPRDIDAVTVARGVEALGAGEIMLNCIDRDGTNSVLRATSSPRDACRTPLDRKSAGGHSSDRHYAAIGTRAPAICGFCPEVAALVHCRVSTGNLHLCCKAVCTMFSG